MAKLIKEIYCIGIDSSTSCTGISFIKSTGKKTELLHFRKIIPPTRANYIQKLIYTYDEIKSFYTDFKEFDPEIAIELLNSSKNMKTTRMLAGLWAFIITSFYKDFGKRVYSMNTGSVKKLATGDGGADKQKVIKFINKKFDKKFVFSTNKEVSDDDVCDSIAVAMAYTILFSSNKIADPVWQNNE